VVVLTVAVGIAANATVWSWLEHIVRRPLPGVERQEDLVVLVSNQGGGNVSRLDLEDFAGLDEVFSGSTLAQITVASLAVGRDTRWVNAQVVSASFFDVLGVRPRLGRTFLPGEDRRPGGDAVLVISERLWRQDFASDPGVVGRVVELNRHAFTIVGVAPAPFRGTLSALAYDVWAPVSMLWEVRNQRLDSRSARGFFSLLRLRPGVSLARARAAVEDRNARLAEAYPDTNRGIQHRLVRMADCPYGAQAVLGPALRLLLAVSLGVLLVVAANLACLALASVAGRRPEIAVELALGASRHRLVRHILGDSLLPALFGGGLGVLLATWGTELLGSFLPAPPLGLALDFPVDARTIGFAFLLTVGTGLAIGLAAALHGTRIDVQESLKAAGRSAAGVAPLRVRHTLVVAQIALALLLSIGAGLCLRGLRKARAVDLGLDPSRVLIAGLQIGMNGYTPETGLPFYRELRRRLAALPGVEEAALASFFPLGLGGCKGMGVSVEGYVRPPGEDRTYEFVIVSPRYFAALGVPLVAGREFGDGDDLAAERVAVVNEAFARRFWPGQDALGRRFLGGGEWRRIVGVAKTGKYNRLDEPPWPVFYLPDQQGVPDLDLGLAVRATGDPRALAGAIRAAVEDLDPGVDLLRVLPLRRYVEGVYFAQRTAATLLLVLGAVAAGLAALGVYGVTAFAVTQRTQEFGLRSALGATPGAVAWLVLRKTLGLTGIGVAIGLVFSLGLSRVLGRFLVGVSPFDPLTYAAVPVLLAAAGALATLRPALRAARVDPVVALRSE
jgi:predicted permease